MKHLLTITLASGLLFTACQSAPDADKAATGEEQAAAAATGTALAVDAATSSVAWIGTKVGGQHNGTFAITDGSLTLDNGTLTGGVININVASVNVLDLEGKDKADLEGHLKSADFFLVDSFPTAKFEITGAAVYDAASGASKLEGATHTITGNLTLRGVTKSISFPAVVSIEGNAVSAKADFNIDRSEWGINFKGPNNPADWLIAKEVNLKFDIKAAAN